VARGSQELIELEKQTGVYRCQLASRILTERLVTDDVDRELAFV
jgi:hypothetical protein